MSSLDGCHILQMYILATLPTVLKPYPHTSSILPKFTVYSKSLFQLQGLFSILKTFHGVSQG